MNIHREEAGEESAPYLCLRQLSKDVNIRLSEPLTGDGSSSASVPTNMFCVASSQRLAAASTRNGINIYDLHVLRNTFTQAERNASPSPPVLCTLPLQPGMGDVLFVMFGNSDSLLLAATSHGLILIWETMSLRSSPPAPRTVAPPRHDASRVHMIAPNPGDKSSLCAVVYGMDLLSHENGSAHMLDLLKGEWVNILPAHNVTSVSWSARGKQLVLGVKTGEIIQFTPEGDVKAVLPPPESDRPLYVEDVQWLENHVFLVTYNTCSSTPEPEPIHENEVYVLYRDAKSNSLTFAAFPYDVSPPFGDRTRWGYRYTCMLRDWSPMKHFVFMTCSASTDVGVLGFKDGWKALVLEETSRPVLPFLSGDDFCDSSPMALALDLTAEDPVPDPNAAEKGEDPSATLPATPILYIYTNDGVLLGYHVIYTETDKPYPGMITGQGAISHSPNASTNVSASIPPAFAESVHGSTTPNRTPTFGSTSAFGAVSQPAFGSTSAFGQQSSFGSAFSNGSPFSKFSASGATAFGGGNALGQKQMPASGQSTQPPSGPAPGQSSEPAFGSTSAFGQLQKPTFGAASTFARAQKPITGSNSAFGQFSQQGTASGLGPTAFSALSNKQNAFGSVSSQGSVFGSGGSFDTGKPAFASVTPAPKALPKSEEPVDEDAPKDSTFSFGGLSDMLSKSNTPMSSQPSANLNLSHQAKFPSEISQNSEPSKATPSVLSESSSKASQNDSDNLEKAESQNFENLESAIVDAKQDEAHEGNFASLHDTPTVQKSEQADKVTFDLFKGKQENQTSSFNESGEGIKETEISPIKAAGNNLDASLSTLAKPSEEKPKEPAFSIAKPSDEKPKESTSFFAQPTEKPKESAFSFSKPFEEKPKESAFSFAKPTAEKPKESAFTFNKPSEEKAKQTAFSFNKPFEEKPKESAFSFNKPSEEKPKVPAFSFAKPSEEKAKEPALSFAKPTAENLKESAFSFNKPSEEKPKESAFSFTKPSDEKPKEPAFSFAKPVEEKPKESAFSFAKPPEEKLEKNKTTGSDTEVFSHKASPERLIESQKLSKGSEFGTNHAAEPSSNALVDNELPAIGVSLAESVPQIDLTQVADPNVPKEDDELKQEFVKIYAILEEELRTLRRQTKQSTDFFTRLRIPSTSPKSVDDLSNADAWVFGDVQSLSSLTSEFLQAVIESEDQVAETRKHIASIESVQLKSEVKREEIARFLRARQDPDFAKMVRVRHLGPEQLENQTRLRRSSHLVRERLSELGEYFNGLQKSTLNAKQGQTTLRAPTLDTIYRSADNIGRLVSARIRELDKMGQDVDAAVPRSTVRARTPHSPARPLDNMADLDTALPEVSEITGINQAGMMHDICDAIWESKKTPVVTRASQTKFISSVPYQMSPIVLHCSQAPTCQKAPVQESDKGKQSETLVMTEPSTKNFLATATPNGIHAHSPMQPRQKVTSAFQRLSTLPTLTSHSNPTSSAQYTTFEGLVGPQPTASSETRDLTLEEFIAQDEEDNGDYTEEESYEDFDDDLEDEEEEEEANESDAS